jgi:hypothetical protein
MLPYGRKRGGVFKSQLPMVVVVQDSLACEKQGSVGEEGEHG